MKVVLSVGGLAAEFGGPSRSVPALAEAVGRAGLDVELIACESKSGQSEPILTDSTHVTTQLVPARARHQQWCAKRNEFYFAIRDSVGQKSQCLIHDNGLWLPTNHAAAAAARTLKRPLVISPRGMLSSWAFKHHRWKKRVAWSLFQRRDLASAAALHATAMEEAREFRRAGLRQPIAVVPNGVTLPDRPANLTSRCGKLRTALFLSRVHPKKGLLDLVAAWDPVRPAHWRVIVAGNDEENHRRAVEDAVRHAQLESVFSFAGTVSDEAKWDLYREADLFVLPTYSENFGIVIAEALASGVPVITTRGAPWRDLVEHRCGWWTEIGAVPLAEALRAATGASDEERSEMGRRGRLLIEKKYSWSRVAVEFIDLYKWLLGEGDRPSCVIVG